jgi:hypothetical protein
MVVVPTATNVVYLAKEGHHLIESSLETEFHQISNFGDDFFEKVFIRMGYSESYWLGLYIGGL